MSPAPTTVEQKAAKARRAGAESSNPVISPLHWIGVEKRFGHGGPYIDFVELVEGRGSE